MAEPTAPPLPSARSASAAGGWGPHRAGVSVCLATAVVVLVVVAAVHPALLASGDPLRIDLTATLRPPSLAHPFGTDPSGRGVYTRIIYGTRQSLLIGLGATTLAMAVALVLGLLAGLAGRLVDGAVSRAIEVLFAFPVLLLALLFVAVFGKGVATLVIAVGLGSAPGYARIIRGQLLVVRGSAYVEAARALGHPFPAILRRHILPNALRPLVVTFTLGIGQSVVWASGLAFLGLGVPPPSPEWGALLDAGRGYVTHAWWLELPPGLAIVLVTLSLTVLGRYIQQLLDGGNSA